MEVSSPKEGRKSNGLQGFPNIRANSRQLIRLDPESGVAIAKYAFCKLPLEGGAFSASALNKLGREQNSIEFLSLEWE